MILYNGKEILFGQFPNGEVNLKKDYFNTILPSVITLKYGGDADLFHLLLVKESLNTPATLRITYVPYSRMDRDSDIYAFSLKTFTNFINGQDWKEVVVYEPHSDVLPALLDMCRVVHVTGSPLMRSRINEAFGTTDYQVCFPDVGAFKRYSDSFKVGDPLIAFKLRDFETGKILALNVTGERTKDDVVIVDDLCSKGGTFVMAAQQLKAMGFKRIILAVAHCENTIFKGEVFSSGLIDKVITTDSILHNNGAETKGLQIIPLAMWD